MRRMNNAKMMVVVTNLGGISYLVKGNEYVYEKAVDWARAEQKRLLKEKGERLSQELMKKMTPFIMQKQRK